MWFNSTLSKKLFTRCHCVLGCFLGLSNLIAPVICLFREQSQNFLHYCKNMYTFAQLIKHSANSIVAAYLPLLLYKVSPIIQDVWEAYA